MSELGDYLMTNYYRHYKGDRLDIVPDPDRLNMAINNHPDRFVIIRDDKIRCVAIYLSLSDETVDRLIDLDITRLDVLTHLLKEHGPHVHFILLAADGITTILRGIREVKQREHPKSISWWDPEMKRFHKYNLKKGE